MKWERFGLSKGDPMCFNSTKVTNLTLRPNLTLNHGSEVVDARSLNVVAKSVLFDLERCAIDRVGLVLPLPRDLLIEIVLNLLTRIVLGIGNGFDLSVALAFELLPRHCASDLFVRGKELLRL